MSINKFKFIGGDSTPVLYAYKKKQIPVITWAGIVSPVNVGDWSDVFPTANVAGTFVFSGLSGVTYNGTLTRWEYVTEGIGTLVANFTPTNMEEYSSVSSTFDVTINNIQPFFYNDRYNGGAVL